ncbi:MAG: ECF transporter S component [Clostridiales bacterium]|nr:ECF transporter S component [Clostridiales bacterium]
MNKSKMSYAVVCIGVFAALIFVMTMFVKIPSPITPGAYYHLGDGVIFVVAYLFGPVVSALTAAISSTLADVLLGVAIYAPATFIIKGCMGLVCSAWFSYLLNKGNAHPLRYVFPMICSVIIMCVGYYLWEVLVMSVDYLACLPGVLANAVQGTAGIILFYILYVPVRRIAKGNIERIK